MNTANTTAIKIFIFVSFLSLYGCGDNITWMTALDPHAAYYDQLAHVTDCTTLCRGNGYKKPVMANPCMSCMDSVGER